MSSSRHVTPPDETPLPWYGIDIGGSLTKVVYFEPYRDCLSDLSREQVEVLAKIRTVLLNSNSYGTDGLRDSELQIDNVSIGGRRGSLHFIRFPTSRVNGFINFVKSKKLSAYSSTVCATGGGAEKFQKVIEEQLNLTLHRFDELGSVVKGVEYIASLTVPPYAEFYQYQSEEDIDNQSGSHGDPEPSEAYPFLLVNIGSGVSIHLVERPGVQRRICGTSIGGGTFLGLATLLTNCRTFEEALSLAESGNNANVDKLVRHIYGGDYSEYGLSGDTVASSFGLLTSSDVCRSASHADLARSLLVTVTNNIGSLVRLCATAEGAKRVIFAGNFLRVNRISIQSLSSAMDYWSGGAMKALFCRHEGYLGALGCLLNLVHEDESRLTLNEIPHDSDIV